MTVQCVEFTNHFDYQEYIKLVGYIVIWWNPFIRSSNLDDVSTYNHMALISLRRRSLVKESMVLTKADHLFIQNYII